MRNAESGVFAIPANFIDKRFDEMIKMDPKGLAGMANKSKTIMVGAVAFVSYGSPKLFRHGVVAIDKDLLNPTSLLSIKNFVSKYKPKEAKSALASAEEIGEVAREWKRQTHLCINELPELIKESEDEFEAARKKIEE